MNCTSDESSEVSDKDIDDYAEKAYNDLKSGKFVARLDTDRFICPFCPGQQDFCYDELLQHAVWVSASNRAAKVKANHQALANLLKTDYADAADSLLAPQVVAHINSPKPVQDQELFVWPWMGILANVTAEQAHRDGAILMQQLADFNISQFNVVHTGFAVVCFAKDWVGFKDALAFHNYYKSRHLGKIDWNEANHQGENYIYGWLAKEEEFKADDPVGRFLSAMGELKTVSELQHDLYSKNETSNTNLRSQVSSKSRHLLELECVCNKMNLSLQRAMEEMQNMQSAAREYSLRIFEETDELRKKVDEKESDIQRRSKQLREIVAQTDMERRKLENEKQKNAGQNGYLNMVRIGLQKANEGLLMLVEKQKKEKEDALKKILDEKRKLELDIEQLKGWPEVVKHMDGEGVDVKKRSEELTAELDRKIEDMADLDELNQTLIVKERKTNDELQDAKKELIKGLADLLGPRSNIGIKRMGEFDQKPFVIACDQRFSTDAKIKAAKLCSEWQDHLMDPNWHPFKIVTKGAHAEQIIDEHDERLVGLKEQLGEEVYQAVTTALLEIMSTMRAAVMWCVNSGTTKRTKRPAWGMP